MNSRQISRRKFFKVASLALGGVALAAGTGCGPAMAQESPQPRLPENVEVETPSYTYGKGQAMNKRILVVYATRTGSTVGVASAIGETLGARGFSVDVKPVRENPSTAGYQAVVIGSAVNGGKWLPEAVEFVENNRQSLQAVPAALFCVHIMNMGDDETSKKNRLAYLNAVRPLLKPADEAFFAGMGMKADEQSGFVRWIYRTFKIGGEGDCRDWDKIRGWAQTVAL